MKLKILSVLFLLVLGIACTQISGDNELMTEELLEKIMQANENIDSMKFNMDSEISLQAPDESMDMTMQATGMIDRLNQKIAITGDVEIKEQGINMPLETYADGEWIYTNNMGQWIKMQMSADMFENQDQAKYFADFLKEGEVNIKEVSKDGKEYYFAEIIPNEKIFKAFIEQNTQIPQEELSQLDEIIQSFENFKLVYYVNKENYMIDFVETSYDMSFNDVKMSSSQELNMFDMGQPVDIVIPEEAKQNAVSLEELQQQMMQA